MRFKVFSSFYEFYVLTKAKSVKDMCDVINANQEDREQIAEELKQSLESALRILNQQR